MLDFFVIFSKSGIVLFATVNDTINNLINKLIKHVILEDRRDNFSFDNITLKYHLENEFDLVFVVGYQKILSLSYIDKFLDDVQLAFRDKFNDFDLRKLLQNEGHSRKDQESKKPFLSFNLVNFYSEYKSIYSKCCKMQQNVLQHQMRSFQQSSKSKKTVASMIVQPAKNNLMHSINESKVESVPASIFSKLINKSPRQGPAKNEIKKKSKEPKVNNKTKKTKEARQWNLDGKNSEGLDFSKKENSTIENVSSIVKNIAGSNGSVALNSSDIEPDLELECSDEDEEEMEKEVKDDKDKQEEKNIKNGNKKSLFGSFIKSFSYNKVLEKSDFDSILTQLRDHLIAKNVASEIATKLCESVETKLKGQQVNTWLGLKSFVRSVLEDSMLRILSPNRNINILRDIKSKAAPPYVMVFCGVNGVGKSTNLAKIANWLVLNGNKVMIIACDTFRAGAIEQLRTHVTALKTIHEKDGKNKIDLYEKGYGKDSAAIAMEAINYARNLNYNVCMIDTAGRMQDNEPLMKQLAKLIKINEPDLTLFVGEALVGNEAVDQLNKFNTSLLDNGCKGITNNSSAINGIVLTKFDTIDDQVGAAISMTYITGQPIIFVGVGQTYKDLKQLNAKAVVKALMK